MSTISLPFPTTRSAAYKAIMQIIAHGPRTAEQLFTEVDFGAHATQKPKLRQAIQAGWIIEKPEKMLEVSDAVRQHFAEVAPKEQYIGQIVPSQYRPSVFASQGISKKNIPNRRGLRPTSDAAPAWSVRETVSIKSIAGGGA